MKQYEFKCPKCDSSDLSRIHFNMLFMAVEENFYEIIEDETDPKDTEFDESDFEGWQFPVESIMDEIDPKDINHHQVIQGSRCKQAMLKMFEDNKDNPNIQNYKENEIDGIESIYFCENCGAVMGNIKEVKQYLTEVNEW